VAAGGAAARTYLTLAAARALECNGCGDCCDSRRTDGYWRWGRLPADQYAGLTGGEALVIPLERTASGWRDRAYLPEDAAELGGTPFRCTAFRPAADGDGSCGRHDAPRPAVCGEFPVGGAELERELAAAGAVALATSAFPRCTWYRVVVVRDGDPRVGGR
jgi:Fe-S-cluster containining protein